MENTIKKVVILGSGNVATRLTLEFQKVGLEIVQIVGRSHENTEKLALKAKVPFTTSLNDIDKNADLYVLSIADDALADILINIGDRLIVHTSGTTPMSVLQRFPNHGVFYPLQTFSVEKEVDFKNIPVCLEASSENNMRLLENVASLISSDVKKISSEQRKTLHVGAVFVNNFTNYLYHIAEDLLKDYDLPFEVLKPLIEETAAKLKTHSPVDSQTGPAKRNDQNVIQNHLNILNDYPEYQKIYQLLSEEIKRKHHKNE